MAAVVQAREVESLNEGSAWEKGAKQKVSRTFRNWNQWALVIRCEKCVRKIYLEDVTAGTKAHSEVFS